MDLEAAKEAAKIVGLNLCATLKHNLGDLDRVKRIVKLVHTTTIPPQYHHTFPSLLLFLTITLIQS